MLILDKYLQELFWKKQQKLPEFVDANDPTLPNPYNFRQLVLDQKITKEDIKKADSEWIPMVKRGWETSEGRDKGFISVIKSAKWWGDGAKLFTIVDKGKRVGIVGSTSAFGNINSPHTNLVYVTWVHGKNYATAGAMKFLNMPQVPQFGKENNKLNFLLVTIDVHKDNISSRKVAENLKAKINSSSKEIIYYYLNAPFWWNNYKLLKY